MHISILRGLTKTELKTRPFVHLVHDQVYSEDIYAKLAGSFPSARRFIGNLKDFASNQAIRIPAGEIIGNPEFDPLWREFFAYHTSRDFWLEVIGVLGDGIRAVHPDLEKVIGKKLEDFVVTRRGSGEPGDVMLDALFVVNTPVQKKSSVRPAHVDSENELFAGLFYMRAADDNTPGGDLALYRFKGSPQFGAHYAELSDLIEENKIVYGANRFVIFVNSEASVHGVTPRPPTDKYRRYINIIGTTERDIFSLPKLPLHRRLWSRLKRRLVNKPQGVMAKKSGY